MSTEKTNDIVRKKQEDIDAKQNEIEETLNTASYKDVKESLYLRYSFKNWVSYRGYNI